MAKVLIIAEHDGKHLNPSTAKCVTCAHALPDPEIAVAVLAADGGAVSQQAAALAGVNRVLCVDNPVNAHALAATWAPQIAALAKDFSHVFGPSTTFGKDLMQLAAQLAQTEPAAAVAWLSEIPDRNARLNGFNQIGEQLAQQDVELAVELVDQVPAENRAQWIASIGNAYAQENVEAAIRWMRKNESTAGYSHLQQQFVWNLASQDPDAALEFASGISDDKQRDMVPFSTLNSCGSSSSEVRLRKRPTRVTRGSFCCACRICFPSSQTDIVRNL